MTTRAAIDETIGWSEKSELFMSFEAMRARVTACNPPSPRDILVTFTTLPKKAHFSLPKSQCLDDIKSVRLLSRSHAFHHLPVNLPSAT